jgi:hypothetical protein
MMTGDEIHVLDTHRMSGLPHVGDHGRRPDHPGIPHRDRREDSRRSSHGKCPWMANLVSSWRRFALLFARSPERLAGATKALAALKDSSGEQDVA